MSSRFHKTEFDLLPERAFRPRAGGGMTLEGGKGSDAPAPDPRLVDAQIRSMGIQDQAITRIIDTSNEMLPLQREQLRLGLDNSKIAWDQAQEDRTWALGRRAALERAQDPLLREAEEFNEGDRRRAMMREAEADISSAFGNARGQQTRALQRMGVNPNSGKFRSFNTQSNIGEAIARASAGRRVSEAAKAEGMALRTNSVNMLSGYPAMASSLSGSGFNFGTSGLNMANQGVQGMNSGFGAGASAAGGMGANAAGMYGAMGNYKSAQDKIAADSDPLSTVLGAATSIGTKWALGRF